LGFDLVSGNCKITMSNSPSPGSDSDLVIDDEDLDRMELTEEDLSKAEAQCGVGTGGFGQVLARAAPVILAPPPNATSTFKFGGTSSVFTSPGPVPMLAKNKISSADPRTKFKPSGFLGLNPTLPAIDKTAVSNIHNNNVDVNFNLQRTVPNSAGSTSFFKSSPTQEQPKKANQSKFIFGSPSSLPTSTNPSKPQLRLAGPVFSPPQSPTDTGHEDSQGEDLANFVLMKEQQKAKIRAEKQKMEQIEKLIEQKKLKQQQHQQEFYLDKKGFFDPEVNARKREVLGQELELKKQTTMMLKMQKDMMMKMNAKEEMRRLEEKKQMLELQVQVQNLENLLATKKAQGGAPMIKGQVDNTRPVRDRLGSKPEYSDLRGSGEDSEDWRAARKRRLGISYRRGDAFQHEGGVSKKRKKNYSNAKLPDDLVLTELTDQGPVKKEDLEGSCVDLAKDVHADEDEEDLDRYEVEGELDPELVLTEFGDNGPIKAVDFSSTSGK